MSAVSSPFKTIRGYSRADFDALTRISKAAHARLHDPQLNVAALADTLAMSPRSLHRSLVRLTGAAPVAWLRNLRIARAREHLLAGTSVAEAAHAVGMAPAYLARVYRTEHGISPSQEKAEVLMWVIG